MIFTCKTHRLLSAILICMLLFALCGCNSRESHFSSSMDPNIAASATSTAEAAASESDGTVTMNDGTYNTAGTQDKTARITGKTTAASNIKTATSHTAVATQKVSTPAPTKTKISTPTPTKTNDSSYTNPYGVYDVLKTYIYHEKVTKEDLLPCVAYIENGKIKDTLFDSIIFLPSPANVYGDALDTKNDWQMWINQFTFRSGANMDALEEAAAETKAALGNSHYQVNAFVTLINPAPAYCKNFGELNGKMLDFNNQDDRFTALKWMVDEYIAKFKAKKYAHVRLAGFYWFDEYVREEEDFGITRKITDYVRSKGYITIFSPFHRARGYDKWKDYGFDMATMQANYFPDEPTFPNAGGIDRLSTTATLIQARGLGFELEWCNPRKSEGVTGFKNYMKAGVEQGYMQNVHLYYIQYGATAVKSIANNRNAYFRSAYDDLYKFIKRTLKVSDIVFK